MTLLAVDASVAVKWLVTEADSAQAITLLDHDLLAPDLLGPECANILWKKHRRGLIGTAVAQAAMALLARLRIELVPSAPHLQDALSRAIRQDHSAYDCVYLAVAAARQAPLVTADRRLAALAGDGTEVLLLDHFA